MTPAWKKLVLLKLRERGRTVPWLAAQLKMATSSAYKLFAENPDGSMVQVGSSEVPRICALLGLPPPLVDADLMPEPRDARLAELLRIAPDSLKDAIIEILSRALSQK